MLDNKEYEVFQCDVLVLSGLSVDVVVFAENATPPVMGENLLRCM